MNLRSSNVTWQMAEKKINFNQALFKFGWQMKFEMQLHHLDQLNLYLHAYVQHLCVTSTFSFDYIKAIRFIFVVGDRFVSSRTSFHDLP